MKWKSQNFQELSTCLYWPVVIIANNTLYEFNFMAERYEPFYVTATSVKHT